MRVDELLELTDKIEDVDLVKAAIDEFKNVESNKVEKLMDKLKECAYNANALRLAISSNVLKKEQ